MKISRSSAILLLCALPAAACNSEASLRAEASLQAEARVGTEADAPRAPQPLALLAPPRAASPAADTADSAGKCDPNYDPCVPIDSDVDCAGGGGNGPSYVRGPVRVIRRDIYRLDHDRDGIGCE
jgi:hypothetical protein